MTKELYLITDGKENLLTRVEEALLGGVTIVQYREKNKSFAEMVEEAKRLKELCQRFQVPLYMNDYPELAKAVDADGLHLGQSDGGFAVARKLVGNIPIGMSARTVEEAKEAEKMGAAYVGVGALFPTISKSDPVFVSMEMAQAIKDAVSIPMYVVGGVSLENMEQITCTYDGICTISAILSAENPRVVAEQFVEKLK